MVIFAILIIITIIQAEDSGKVCLVHQDAPGHDWHPIFFDDNIERDRAHVVDVRDAATGLSGIDFYGDALVGLHLPTLIFDSDQLNLRWHQ